MGDKSGIGWTDATWNPTTGCTRVSRGCDNCYAFALHDRRYAANAKAATEYARKIGQLDVQRRGHAQHVRSYGAVTPADLPYPAQYDLPFSEVQLLPDRLDQPLRWRRPRRIFVDSMADLFHEDVPDEYIDRVFATMALAPQHSFEVLTKRPERMREYITNADGRGKGLMAGFIAACLGRDDAFLRDVAEKGKAMVWPLPNVWLGVSVENQHWADIRIPLLLETPAAVRFISAEPLLGPIVLRGEGWSYFPFTWPLPSGEQREAGLDWVIVGGESGRNARPMDHVWAQSIRDQCRAAGVAYFGKQDVSPGSKKLPLPGDLGDQEFPLT